MRILSINPKIIFTAAITNFTDAVAKKIARNIPQVTFPKNNTYSNSPKPRLATH